jgi:selenocysteine lyase/cysteine desulfurase
MQKCRAAFTSTFLILPEHKVRAMQRRDFLLTTGLTLGGVLVRPASSLASSASANTPAPSGSDWARVRALFRLSADWIQLSGFFFASHPKPVRDAIEKLRDGLDDNPLMFVEQNTRRLDDEVRAAASEYLGGGPGDVALTDSTTMGLGILYGGVKLTAGQEILTTTHDHYATEIALQLRADRTGASVRRIPLYDSPAQASTQEMVARVVKSVKRQTRVLAVTWVHSSTGVRVPVRALADALAPINAKRAEGDRVLLCVDGVHGLGCSAERVADLGCDFFSAGCHKWMFGPRGTGVLWGKPTAWPSVAATIPPFGISYPIWEKDLPPQAVPPGSAMTPGGFHSFEHRWALSEAFKLHTSLGRERVAARVTQLNRQLKEGLRKMSGVTVHTPLDERISAGINCFEVAGVKPVDVVKRLREQRIAASVTPYVTKYVRLSASVFNAPAELDRALAAIQAMA